MFSTINFRGKEEDFLFTSDAHLNQVCETWANPLWNQRGYNSAKSHREAFISNWNAVSNRSKICFHLGDFIFYDPEGKEFRKQVRRLEFKDLYMLAGNHNSGQKEVYRSEMEKQFPGVEGELFPLVWDLYDGRRVFFLPQYATIKVNNQFVILCHFPIVSHWKIAKRSYMLCGHSHQRLPLTNKDTGQGLRLDVGFDGWKRPISLAEITKIFKNRNIEAYDHRED